MSGFVKIAIDDYYSDSNWTTIINKYWMLAERVSGNLIFILFLPFFQIAYIIFMCTTNLLLKED